MKKFDRSLPRKARAVTTTDAEGGGEVLSFVSKSFRLCSFLDQNHPSVAGWDKDGEHFEVYNIKQLEGFFQPDYFSHSKFQSFTRQLNMHGFRKLRVDRRGIEASFFHPMFKRNGFELLEHIKRQEHLVDAAGGGESAEMQAKMEAMERTIFLLTQKVAELSTTAAPSSKRSKSSLEAASTDHEEPSSSPFSITSATASGSGSGTDIVDSFLGDDIMSGMQAGELDLGMGMGLGLGLGPLDDDLDMDFDWGTPRPSSTSTSTSSSSSSSSSPSSSLPCPENAPKVDEILRAMNPEMQTRFVDQLAQSLSSAIVSRQDAPSVGHYTATLQSLPTELRARFMQQVCREARADALRKSAASSSSSSSSSSASAQLSSETAVGIRPYVPGPFPEKFKSANSSAGSSSSSTSSTSGQKDAQPSDCEQNPLQEQCIAAIITRHLQELPSFAAQSMVQLFMSMHAATLESIESVQPRE